MIETIIGVIGVGLLVLAGRGLDKERAAVKRFMSNIEERIDKYDNQCKYLKIKDLKIKNLKQKNRMLGIQVNEQNKRIGELRRVSLIGKAVVLKATG